jgi:hypothetical protein
MALIQGLCTGFCQSKGKGSCDRVTDIYEDKDFGKAGN